ncbi:unnamed protein product, partial [Polarella glacialis]
VSVATERASQAVRALRDLAGCSLQEAKEALIEAVAAQEACSSSPVRHGDMAVLSPSTMEPHSRPLSLALSRSFHGSSLDDLSPGMATSKSNSSLGTTVATTLCFPRPVPIAVASASHMQNAEAQARMSDGASGT